MQQLSLPTSAGFASPPPKVTMMLKICTPLPLMYIAA
jgi:hypothetical protein